MQITPFTSERDTAAAAIVRNTPCSVLVVAADALPWCTIGERIVPGRASEEILRVTLQEMDEALAARS